MLTHYLLGRYVANYEQHYIVVRGCTTALDFMCAPQGENARCIPPVQSDIRGDLYAPPFKILHSSNKNNIEIDIYRGNKLLVTVDTDLEGNPITVFSGKHTHIDLEFYNSGIKVTLITGRWEEVEQETEISS